MRLTYTTFYYLPLLHSCVSYLDSPDDMICLRTAHDIYLKHDKYAEALLIAIRMSDKALIQSLFDGCSDPYVHSFYSEFFVATDPLVLLSHR